MFVYQHAA